MSITANQANLFQQLKYRGNPVFAGLGYANPNGWTDAQFIAAFRSAFSGGLSSSDLFALTAGNTSELGLLTPAMQNAILSDVATFLLGAYGLINREYDPYLLAAIASAQFLDSVGNPVDSASVYWRDDGVWLSGESQVFPNQHYNDSAWLSAQLAKGPIARAGLDPRQWRPYTINGANGDLLSIGAEGGLRTYEHLVWVPNAGLVFPNYDYLQVHDDDPNALIGGIIMAVGLSFIGGLVFNALTAAPVATTGPLGPEWTLGTPEADALLSRAGSQGLADLTSGAGLVDPYAIDPTTGLPADLSGATPATALPETLTTARQVASVAQNLIKLSNLTDAAKAVAAIASMYKVVTGASGNKTLVRNPSAPTTYRQVPNYYQPNGTPTNAGISFSSLLPIFAVLGAAFLSR